MRAFDGTDDSISFGSVLTSLDSGPVTFSFFCNARTDPGDNEPIIIWNLSGVGSFSISFQDTVGNPATLFFFRSYVTQNLQITCADNAFTKGVLRHVAMTWDGSATATNVHFYINGIEPSYDFTQNGTGGQVDLSLANFYFAQNDAGTGFWDGLLGHVQLFNRVLSTNEIIMTRYHPGSINKGLMGYWPLWGTSSPEPDYSGNRNNGTVTGATQSNLNPPVGRNFFYPKQRHIWIPSSPAGGQVNINLSEIWTFSDSITKQYQKNLSENYTLSESITKQFIKHIIEQFTWSDTLSTTLFQGLLIALSENFTWADSITKQYTKHLSENLTVSESVSKQYLKHLAENYQWNDALTKQFVKHIVELFTLTESVSKIFLKHLTENFTWSDTVLAQIEVVSVSLAKLLTFIHRGMIGKNDKLSMENDLQTTSISKLDSDMMQKDQDSINWDSHEGI